jgi:hypothetical protein
MRKDWRLTNEISYTVGGLFRKFPYCDRYYKESAGETALWKVSEDTDSNWETTY